MDTRLPTPHSRNQYRVVAILLLGLIATLLSCTPKPDAVLRVGTNVWTGYEPLYLARELGYLDKTRTRIVEHATATNVIRDYRNGAIDAAALTLDEVLLLAQHKENPRIVLVMDFSHGGDALLAQKEFHDLKSLTGHRIGVESTAMGAYMLKRTLDYAGMLPEDIDIISLSVDQHEQAFLQKEVDAVVTFEPVLSLLLSNGAQELFNSARIPGEIVDVLVVREEYLQAHPEIVYELVNAWFRALQFHVKEPEKAIDIMARREGISAADFTNNLNKLLIPNLEENLLQLGGTPPKLLHAMNQLQSVMLQNNLLKNNINIELLLYPQALWEYEKE